MRLEADQHRTTSSFSRSRRPLLTKPGFVQSATEHRRLSGHAVYDAECVRPADASLSWPTFAGHDQSWWRRPDQAVARRSAISIVPGARWPPGPGLAVRFSDVIWLPHTPHATMDRKSTRLN